MAHQTSKGRKASDEACSNAAALVAVYDSLIPTEEAGLALLAAWECFVDTGWLPAPSGACSQSGRRASDEARDAAAKLLDAFGPALRTSGPVCMNPDDDPEDQVFVSAQQAAYALYSAMVRLAETGWLVETEVKLDRLIIREYFYEVIRPERRGKQVALEKLGQKYRHSIRDLERIVGKTRP
jgi:hypothetical protein